MKNKMEHAALTEQTPNEIRLWIEGKLKKQDEERKLSNVNKPEFNDKGERIYYFKNDSEAKEYYKKFNDAINKLKK